MMDSCYLSISTVTILPDSTKLPNHLKQFHLLNAPKKSNLHLNTFKIVIGSSYILTPMLNCYIPVAIYGKPDFLGLQIAFYSQSLSLLLQL